MPSRSSSRSPYSIHTDGRRLVEARVFHLRTREDADGYSELLAAHVRRVPGADYPVLLADHRPVIIYPQAVANRLVELFQDMNTRLDRVAIVASRSNATMVFQLEKLIREASHAKRRLFFTSEDALEHLSPSLTSHDLQRARTFLDGYRAA